MIIKPNVLYRIIPEPDSKQSVCDHEGCFKTATYIEYMSYGFIWYMCDEHKLLHSKDETQQNKAQ